jgi:hypothetical protein
MRMPPLQRNGLQTRPVRRRRVERWAAGSVLLIASLGGTLSFGAVGTTAGSIHHDSGNVGIGTTNLLKTAGIALVDR